MHVGFAAKEKDQGNLIFFFVYVSKPEVVAKLVEKVARDAKKWNWKRGQFHYYLNEPAFFSIKCPSWKIKLCVGYVPLHRHPVVE